jgi:hypothetical protein
MVFVVLVLEWCITRGMVLPLNRIGLGKRLWLIVIPRHVVRLGFLTGNHQGQVLKGIRERPFIILPTASPFLERALQPLLLAAVVLEHLVP